MSFRKFSADEDTQLCTLVDMNGVEVYKDNAHLDRYKVTDMDTSGATQYFGYTDIIGAWYLMENNTTTNTFRYVSGDSAYPTAWTNRASQTYDYFYNIF